MNAHSEYFYMKYTHMTLHGQQELSKQERYDNSCKPLLKEHLIFEKVATLYEMLCFSINSMLLITRTIICLQTSLIPLDIA